MERHILIVMELAAGGELLDYLARTDRNEALVRSFFQQLVLGVKFCHSQGVAHRDLKPANLLVGGASGTVLKIADFGLAAEFEPSPSLRCSRQSLRYTLCGSPLYMAPELLNSPRARGTTRWRPTCGRSAPSSSRCSPAARPSARRRSPSSSGWRAPRNATSRCLFGCRRSAARCCARCSPSARSAAPRSTACAATRGSRPTSTRRSPSPPQSATCSPRQLDVVLGLALLPAIVGLIVGSPLARRSSSALSSAAAGPPSPDGSPDVSPEGRRGGGPPDGPSDGDHGAGGIGLADASRQPSARCAACGRRGGARRPRRSTRRPAGERRRKARCSSAAIRRTPTKPRDSLGAFPTTPPGWPSSGRA